VAQGGLTVDEFKVIEGSQGHDGGWKAVQIGKDRLEGDLTTQPDLDRVIDYLTSQGWKVSSQTEGGKEGDRRTTVTLARPVPNENDELYKALGYERPPLAASPELIEHSTRLTRDLLRFSGGG